MKKNLFILVGFLSFFACHQTKTPSNFESAPEVMKEVVLAEPPASNQPAAYAMKSAPKSKENIAGKKLDTVDKQAAFNTEDYAAIVENEFINPKNTPLSTFSIDVDNAAYSNVRRFLQEGKMPPKNAVRLEEMINYFDYDYPQPTDGHPLSISTDLADCPWKKTHYLLRIGMKGKEIDPRQAPVNNLVFLIDVSGSMSDENKLPLVKKAFKVLVNNLRANDKVSIVVYAGAAGVVLPATSGDKKDKILAALDKLESGGSTAGGEGILLAYKIAKENFVKEGNNRVIVATDGDFNIGPSSDGDLTDLIEQKRKDGVFLTVLGFGMGNYKDNKLEILADKGNGNYAYIDNEREAYRVFNSEMTGTLYTIAKDVKLQLEFNPKKVAAYRLIGYENRLLNAADFNDDTKDAGDLGVGHTVTALYEIIPQNAANTEGVRSVDNLKYQQNQTTPSADGADWVTIKFRYKKPDADKSLLLEKVVNQAPVAWSQTSTDFRFATSVASFGMLLRQSKFKGTASYASVKDMAQNALGKDESGYRTEF